LKRKPAVGSVVTLLVAALFTLAAFASDAQMYFSSDKNGQNRVTNIAGRGRDLDRGHRQR